MWGLPISDLSAQLEGHGHPAQPNKLEACVRHVFQSEGVPAFCKHVSDVMARTLNIESSSMELARIILKDLGLTSQILRIANSALYNRSGRPVMSVAHAITLLGWDTVRTMLSAIRYVEHFANGSPGLRELMLLSVLNAVHSRDIAAAIGHPHPEEAYIGGLFGNLGEVLVACHYPHEYSEIIVAMYTEKIPARAACLRVLDFSWDDVGRRLAEAWNMPSKVRLCLHGPGTPPGSPIDRSLASITDYTYDLTDALYRKGAGIDTVHLRCVAHPDGSQALVSVRDLRRIADSGVAETRETFSQLGIPVDRLLLERQAEGARSILDASPVFDAAKLDVLDQAIARAKHALDRGGFELSAVIAALLDSVEAAGFDRVVFGLVNETRTLVRGRLTSRGSAGDLRTQFQFPLEHAEGPILAALVRRTDVLVDRARDDRYDGSALVNALRPGAFALFPIVKERRAVGCLYADRQKASPGLNAARPSLGRARDVIAFALQNSSKL